MKYYTILLFLGLIMLNGDNSSLARAETVIEDLGEEIPLTPEEEPVQPPPTKTKPSTTTKIPQKTEAERKKIKQEKRETKQKLESCLVITRSYYKLYEDKFDTYLREHKSTQGMKKAPSGGVTADTPAELKKEIEQGRNNHSMLLSKINGQMLLRCNEQITKEQIKVLQKHKSHPEGFDALREGYSKLVEIDLADNDDAGLTGVKLDGVGRVVYSNAESKVLQMIEDINESMTKEQKKFKNKQAKQNAGVNIAGFETSNLSKSQQLLLMIFIYVGIGVSFYYFYQRCLVQGMADEDDRRARKEAKKSKKKN